MRPPSNIPRSVVAALIQSRDMGIPVDADAFIGLLDETLSLYGEVEPCKVRWSLRPGGWDIQVLTNHTLRASGIHKAYVGLFYEQDGEMKIWYVLSILGDPGINILIGPDY